MVIIKPSYKILTRISPGGIDELKMLEEIGRVCYKSEDKISPDGESAKTFVKMIIKRGHESIIEHGCITVKFICDRGISHEIVRHRLASFAQESTRYVNYSNERKNPSGITFIEPFFIEEGSNMYRDWATCCEDSEFWYLQMIKEGATPQMARAALNNSVKTELVMTANYREWRHFLNLRTDISAHPQMRELTVPLLKEFKERLPVIFDDIEAEWS